MARHISDLLSSISSQNTALWQYRLLDQWPTIIGDLGKNIVLQKINKDSIVLGVNDSCWLQELYLLSPLILDLVNKTLDQPYIKRIHFRLITRKKVVQKSNITTVSQKDSSDFVRRLSSQESTAIKKIDDSSLRSLLLHYRTRCQKQE